MPKLKTANKPRWKTLRNKADKLLMDYIRAKYPACLVCAKPVSCGHHFVNKSNSNALRYYLPNIIPICRDCHFLVHNQPHLIEPKICFKLGKAWHDDLLRVKQAGVKANWQWYQDNLETIKELNSND